MRRRPVFPNVYTLPCAQPQRTAVEGDGKIHRRQRRPDVGRHVIVSFRRVHKQGITIRNKPFEEAVQIRTHVGISIFLDQNGCGSVLKVECDQALRKTRLGNQCLHFFGHLVKPATFCPDHHLFLELF